MDMIRAVTGRGRQSLSSANNFGVSSPSLSSNNALDATTSATAAAASQEQNYDNENNVANSRKSSMLENARKSMKIWVPMSNNAATSSSLATKRGEDQAPPVPNKKIRMSDEAEEEEDNGATNVEEDIDTNIPSFPQRPRVSLALKEKQRLVRQASSNGSQSTSETTSSAGGAPTANMFHRIAKNNIQFTEMKNKLEATQKLLAVANKRIEELEKEHDRLIRENREMRRKLEASNPNGSNRGRSVSTKQAGPQQPAVEGSLDDSGEEVHTIKIENLDKSMSSKSLMQMIENHGVEVTTVRICKNASTGALSGYCSFSSLKDAHKAIDALKKLGHTVNIHSDQVTTGSAGGNSSLKKWKS